MAADSVAGEFTWGTIKLLLIRPWSRSKILLSKYISLVIFSLVSTGVLILFGYGSAFIFLFRGCRDYGGDSVMGWGARRICLHADSVQLH
ncbi:ABC transporter permease [Paenibacillus rhizoplanae]